MLDLILREEFRGKRLKGTTVDFTNTSKTGALDVSASDFLKITYPSFDLLKTVEATAPGQVPARRVAGGQFGLGELDAPLGQPASPGPSCCWGPGIRVDRAGHCGGPDRHPNAIEAHPDGWRDVPWWHFASKTRTRRRYVWQRKPRGLSIGCPTMTLKNPVRLRTIIDFAFDAPVEQV